MVLIQHPFKMVYDETGHLVEVIVSAADFLAYLRSVQVESDWETLPVHVQDAIDRMLIDEVRAEKETTLDLDAVLLDDERSR
jgi:hypothetical protein